MTGFRGSALENGTECRIRFKVCQRASIHGWEVCKAQQSSARPLLPRLSLEANDHLDLGHDLSRNPPQPPSAYRPRNRLREGPQSDVRELTCDRQMVMRRRWSSFGPLVATIA